MSSSALTRRPVYCIFANLTIIKVEPLLKIDLSVCVIFLIVGRDCQTAAANCDHVMAAVFLGIIQIAAGDFKQA